MTYNRMDKGLLDVMPTKGTDCCISAESSTCKLGQLTTVAHSTESLRVQQLLSTVHLKQFVQAKSAWWRPPSTEGQCNCWLPASVTTMHVCHMLPPDVPYPISLPPPQPESARDLPRGASQRTGTGGMCVRWSPSARQPHLENGSEAVSETNCCTAEAKHQ